ncbi:protein kinase [Endozoicomonas sp. ONNA2]|uniref:protein kinase domain-containing protein n=1 Tax=Endozoicomonas sp. ONNA2 TaxID=2828741 RepID=UPI002148F034|nr:protein kinase [Endozoicomonas sp. ONNA2]
MIDNTNQERLLNTPGMPTSRASSSSDSIEAPSYRSRFAQWLVRNYKESLMALLCAAGGYALLKSSSSTSLAGHKIIPAQSDSPRTGSSLLQGIDPKKADKPTLSITRIECLFDHESFRRFMDDHFKGVDYPEWYRNFMQQEDTCSVGENNCPVASDQKTGEEYENPCQQKPDFLFHSRLSTGDFNPAYRITTKDGQPFTMKVVNDTDDFLEECFTYARLGAHISRKKSGAEYLTGILGISSIASPLNYLITEAFNSTLLDFLKGLNEAPDKQHIQSIFRQMLKGVQAIHRVDRIHNHLKPDNIFMSSNGDIKIANLGTAKPTGRLADTGAIEYSAPEILQFNNHRLQDCVDDSVSKKAPCRFTAIAKEQNDIWSLGVIFAQLFPGDAISPLIGPETGEYCRENPQTLPEAPLTLIDFDTAEKSRRDLKTFTNECVFNYLIKQRELITNRIHGYDADAADLFSRLTEPNPTKRISVNEALQHPYLQKNA